MMLKLRNEEFILVLWIMSSEDGLIFSFHFLNSVFDRAESLDFDEVQFINLFIYGYASYLRNLYLTQATKIFFCVFF